MTRYVAGLGATFTTNTPRRTAKWNTRKAWHAHTGRSLARNTWVPGKRAAAGKERTRNCAWSMKAGSTVSFEPPTRKVHYPTARAGVDATRTTVRAAGGVASGGTKTTAGNAHPRKAVAAGRYHAGVGSSSTSRPSNTDGRRNVYWLPL